jgi:hypothetical protein
MLCLSYYAYIFSSAKSEIRAEWNLPGTEGGKGVKVGDGIKVGKGGKVQK